MFHCFDDLLEFCNVYMIQSLNKNEEDITDWACIRFGFEERQKTRKKMWLRFKSRDIFFIIFGIFFSRFFQDFSKMFGIFETLLEIFGIFFEVFEIFSQSFKMWFFSSFFPRIWKITILVTLQWIPSTPQQSKLLLISEINVM